MNLNQLPVEILEIILSCYADNKIIVQFSLTHPRFNNIINSCLEVRKIYDLDIIQCFICNKCSISPFPILYIKWPHQGEDIITDSLCSNKCRKSCLDIKEPFFCVAFYFYK